MLLHIQVGLTLYVIPKWASLELAGFQKLLPPFKHNIIQLFHSNNNSKSASPEL